MEASQPVVNLVAAGPGWRLNSVSCTARGGERPFEERHDSHLLAITTEGHFAYHGAVGRQLIHSGSILTAHAGQCYCCSHRHDGGDHCLALQIDEELFGGISSAEAGSANFCFPTPSLPVTRELMPAVARLASYPSLPLDEGAVFDFAAQVIRVASGTTSRRSVSIADEMRVEAALRFAEARATEPLTLAMLAKVAGLSRFHFARTFKLVVGLTPYQHILRLRLNRVGMLLLNSKKPIAEIAFDCGFADLSTFNAKFKSVFGQSPQVFRRSV
jgi:AraC family transcriptional regulator